MIVGERGVRRVIEVIEDNANRRGWDRGAELFMLLGLGRRSVQIGHPIGVPGEVGERLASVAVAMWSGEMPTPPVPERFVGWAVCAEAWKRAPLDEAEVLAHHRGERPPLADQVGSVEMRMVVAADTSGRLLTVTRERGQAPLLNLGYGPDDDGELRFEGRIPVAMRLMVAASCKRAKPDAYAIEGLDRYGDQLCEMLVTGETITFPKP